MNQMQENQYNTFADTTTAGSFLRKTDLVPSDASGCTKCEQAKEQRQQRRTARTERCIMTTGTSAAGIITVDRQIYACRYNVQKHKSSTKPIREKAQKKGLKSNIDFRSL
jgi:hypothetical protein